MRTVYTIFQVPYMSLGVELTQNYQERTSIAQYRYLIGPTASLVTVAIAWNFFFVGSESNPNPQLIREPYFAYALLSSVLMALLLIGTAWGPFLTLPGQTRSPENLIFGKSTATYSMRCAVRLIERFLFQP